MNAAAKKILARLASTRALSDTLKLVSRLEKSHGFGWKTEGALMLARLRAWAVAIVYKCSRDLFLAQRFARHASPLTTVIYTHPSDEEMYKRIRNLFG